VKVAQVVCALALVGILGATLAAPLAVPPVPRAPQAPLAAPQAQTAALQELPLSKVSNSPDLLGDSVPVDAADEAVTFTMASGVATLSSAESVAVYGIARSDEPVLLYRAMADTDRDAAWSSVALRMQDSEETTLTGADAIASSAVPTAHYQGSLVQRNEPVADPQPASHDGLALLVAASQQTLALLGLTPQPGVGPSLFDAGQFAPRLAAAPALQPLAGDVPAEMPGWLLQATWTVALAAFGLAALREAGLFVALFSRFNREDVLENERRSRLHEAIRADPGVSFGRLARLLGLAHGAAQHHLRQLEAHGLVRRAREGRTTHYYPAGPRFESPVALAPARRALLDALRAEPGLTLNDLAQRNGHRPQSVWDHLDRLRRAGLVFAERRGRSLTWRLPA